MFRAPLNDAGLRQAAIILLLLAAPVRQALSSTAEDRFEILELMDRYGVVHDLGSPEEYADLFTEDGEISAAKGPVLVKGRQALIEQARQDHERFGGPTQADGTKTSIMRHIITDRIVRLTGAGQAQGSSYVITLINDKSEGPQILSFSRYEDTYRKIKGVWRISHRSIIIESGNSQLGKKIGFK